MPTNVAPESTTLRSAPAARQAVRVFPCVARHRSGRMRTISYGKERPVAVCNDISCWSQNRRAVTVLERQFLRGVPYLFDFQPALLGRRFLRQDDR